MDPKTHLEETPFQRDLIVLVLSGSMFVFRKQHFGIEVGTPFFLVVEEPVFLGRECLVNPFLGTLTCYPGFPDLRTTSTQDPHHIFKVDHLSLAGF